MKAALKAFESWSRTTVEERASLLFRVADLIRQRKMEFMAWLVFEVSKNWAEADADISETIDFCEFYAREALRFAKAQTPIQLPGEHDTLHYIPLGVGAVIPPWNFPCAIMAGMTLASIVSGNTVILKPSSDSPTIAAKFVELLEEVRHARGRGELLPWRRSQFRRRRRRASQDALHRLHRLARSRTAHQQNLPPRRLPARSGSSARFSKWAAKTPSSSTPMPTSTPPSKASRRPLSGFRDKNVPPARARSSTNASTTNSSNSSKPASKKFRSAMSRKTPPWARSSTKVR